VKNSRANEDFSRILAMLFIGSCVRLRGSIRRIRPKHAPWSAPHENGRGRGELSHHAGSSAGTSIRKWWTNDTQKGAVTTPAQKKSEMMARSRNPTRSSVLYKDGKLSLLAEDESPVYQTNQRRHEVIGAGLRGSGQDLMKSFDVVTQERKRASTTGKLELIFQEREGAQQLLLKGIALDRSESRHLRTTAVFPNPGTIAWRSIPQYA